MFKHTHVGPVKKKTFEPLNEPVSERVWLLIQYWSRVKSGCPNKHLRPDQELICDYQSPTKIVWHYILMPASYSGTFAYYTYLVFEVYIRVTDSFPFQPPIELPT